MILPCGRIQEPPLSQKWTGRRFSVGRVPGLEMRGRIYEMRR
jgi:hypothetical protein